MLTRRHAIVLTGAAVVSAALPAVSAETAWKAAFAAEFSKYVDHRSATATEIAEWIAEEAAYHFANVENPLATDPEEEASEAAYAIAVSL